MVDVDDKRDLKRTLTLLDSTMINVGTIIGSGIFLVPTTVALYLHSSSMTITAWIVAGVVTLFGAITFAELGAAMPRAGGLFVFLKEAYGPVWGFLYGWTGFTVINTGAIAAISVAFATYLGYFHPLSILQIRLVAVGVIALFTILNIIGKRSNIWIQNMLTFVKIGSLIAIVILGFSLSGGQLQNFRPVLPISSISRLIAPFGLAMLAVLWSYDGWVELTFVGGEIKNPSRNIPLALLFSTLIIMALYLLVNLVFIYLLSMDGIGASELVAADASEVVLPGWGTTFVIIAILISTLGAANVFILTCPRIYYSMAREGLFFSSVAKIDPRFGTPVISLLFQGVWSSVLVFSGTFNQLITYVVFASWFFYGMCCAGVIVLRRKRPEMKRPYKTWGYPVVPLVFVATAAFLVINTILNSPRDAIIGTGFILLGVPVFVLWNRRRAKIGADGEDNRERGAG